MNKNHMRVCRRMLNAATDTSHFSDMNDGERLNWMISQAYILGQLAAARSNLRLQRRREREEEEEER